jgi:hypothetical protein
VAVIAGTGQAATVTIGWQVPVQMNFATHDRFSETKDEGRFCREEKLLCFMRSLVV